MFIFLVALATFLTNGEAVISKREVWNQPYQERTAALWSAISNILPLEPEAYMNVPELISHTGYPVEIHTVQTEDNYILEIHRIPYSAGSAPNIERQPILLSHALMCSSACWVFNTRNNSLAFVLSDAGYDVWLVNFRGTSYSRRHLTISPNDRAFWQFSFDEIGRYDVPATIDYILARTSYSKVFLIGHSMGFTSANVMLSTRPEYNNKVKMVVGMAPSFSMSHMYTVIHTFASYLSFVLKATSILQTGEVHPNSELNKLTLRAVGLVFPQLLTKTMDLLYAGFSSEQFNLTRAPVYFSFIPDGSSVYTNRHYVQMIHSNVFKRFDWGRLGNLRKYNDSVVEEYNLKNFVTPCLLVWSENDLVVTRQDVEKLSRLLPNAKMMRVKNYSYSHSDYVFAMDARETLYNRIVNILKKY